MLSSGSRFFSSDSLRSIYVGSAVGVWIYIILRAIFVPLVHDEASTFFHYIHREEFLPYRSHWDANNHILNSALGIFFYKLLGSAEWVLRLPNLLFFPLYAFYTFRLSSLLSSTPTKYLFRFVFLFAHGVIEFMALSRGYGMSMALLLAMCFHFISFLKNSETRDLLAVLGFGVLALVANFNLMVSFLLCLIWLMVVICTDGKSKKLWRISLVLLGGFIPVLMASVVAFELKRQGLLYYGAADGFWEISVLSIFKLLFGKTHWTYEIFIVLFFVWIVATSFFRIFKQSVIKSLRDPVLVFPVLLLAGLSAVYIQNKWMGVNLPEDRTGLHLFIYLLAALFFLKPVLSGRAFRWSSWILLPLLWFPVHFIKQANWSHTTLWKNECMPEKFYDAIATDGGAGGYYASLGGYGIQHMIWYYYNYRNNGHGPMMSYYDYPAWHYDYLLLNPLERSLQNVEKYTLLLENPHSGIGLYERKHRAKRETDTILTIKNLPITTQTEYVDFFNSAAHSFGGDSIAVDIYMELTSPAKPLIASAVVSFDKPDGSLLYYQYVSLHWLRDSYTEQNSAFRHVFFIPALPSDVGRLAIVLWNQKKVPIQIRLANVVISRIR